MIKKDFKFKYSFKDGIVDGVPIVIGFVPIGMAFGILSKTTGITMLDSVLFSFIVFAGSSQFIALNLLLVGAGMGEIILTTLLVNFRHFLMSASLSRRMTNDMKRWSPLIAFCVTDEVFSVASFKEGTLTKEYILTLELSAYLAWGGGTALGYLVGGILPAVVESSMGVAIYAMFASLLIPKIKESTKIAILAVLSGIVNACCKYFFALPQGWSIVISIVLVSLLGVYLFKEGELTQYE